MTRTTPQLRIALMLGAASMIAAACLLPYLLAVRPMLESMPAMLVTGQWMGAGIASLLLGWAGLKLGAPVGPGAPWFGALFYGRALPPSSAWSVAALIGTTTGVALVVIAVFGAPIADAAAIPTASFALAM